LPATREDESLCGIFGQDRVRLLNRGERFRVEFALDEKFPHAGFCARHGGARNRATAYSQDLGAGVIGAPFCFISLVL
jgi:hypothetical protein